MNDHEPTTSEWSCKDGYAQPDNIKHWPVILTYAITHENKKHATPETTKQNTLILSRQNKSMYLPMSTTTRHVTGLLHLELLGETKTRGDNEGG